MRIQHNIAAMNAYRNYNTNTSAVSKNLEKLSSGYKINRAGDDAAGLAISEKMRAQISGLNAASKNVKDGISLVKTAEGAMQEVQDMLNRMVTLATQSANGTYDNEVDRLNLQKEVDQLRSEINRIADSSNFNGIKLMDGSQEIKTTYQLSSPKAGDSDFISADGVFQIVSDGQLGVESQAGVFTYDLSQLTITTPTSASGATQSLAAGDFTQGAKVAATVDVNDIKTKFSGVSDWTDATDSLTVSDGTAVDVKVNGKTYTVTFKDTPTSGNDAEVDASTANTVGKLLSAIETSVNAQLKADSDNNAAGDTAYTMAENFKLTVGTDGTISGAADSYTMTPKFSAGKTETATGTADDPTKTDWSEDTSKMPSSADGQTVSVKIGDETFSVKLYDTENDSAPAADVTAGLAVEYSSDGSSGDAPDAVLAKIESAIKTQLQAANDAGAAGDKDYVKYDVNTFSLTTDSSSGELTGATVDTQKMTVNTPSNNDGSSSNVSAANYRLNLGGIGITLSLKAGTTYSGADMAKEIAAALNEAAAAAAKKAAGSENSLSALDLAPGGVPSDWDGTLCGADFTASFNGSTLTITMDEAPTQKWDQDMTIKFDNHTGNGGEQFKPTVLTEPVDNTTQRQYAQATIDLTKLDIKDGTTIQLGNTTYTFAVGSDSRFTSASNVVDLTDLTQKEMTATSGVARGVIVAANRLSKAAAANTTFYVGSDTQGYVSLTEKEGAVDYSVNNLAGTNNIGTTGGGTSVGGAGHSDPDIDSTLSDWKGLVKIGQASVSGSGLTLQIGDTSDSYNQLTVSIGDIHTKALGIDGIDISTQSGAQSAIDTIKNAINQVSSIRGTLGATQNRLEHTANNLSVMTENIQDAESTIRDTDIAEEMMAYTKNNILVQSAQAMLAQANQIPQGVLQLLG